MALIPIADSSAVSTDLEKKLVRPASVTIVQSSGNPSTDSSWTPTNPRALYQAPSTCKYAKIYWRKSYTANSIYGASAFPSNTTTGFFYILSVTDGTVTREIYRGFHSADGGFNLNQFYNTNLDTTVVLQENDTYISTGSNAVGFIVSGDMFTLAPGETLQLGTGSDANTNSYYANFEAWVYN